MLFPQLGPQYYDEKDRSILTRMEKFYSEAITINQSFWGEADTDTRFMAGDQTLWNSLYGNIPTHRRQQFNFNRIRRIVNMISGYQRRNRKSTIVTPVENGDADTSDQFTKILMHIDRQEGMLHTISQSFHGALVTGLNFLQVWIDYRYDPISGDIRIDNCPYNSFLVDPYFTKPDLSDCNAMWKRTYLTKREIISLLPDKKDEIMALTPTGSNPDGKFQYMAESYSIGMTNLLTYDEYYYRDYRKQKMLIDTQTGEALEWTGDDKDALKQFLQLYPQIKAINQEIPTVKLAIVVQGKVMYDGRQQTNLDCYPFVPVLAYYEPQMPYYPYRIQGVVRGLRDAQYLYNRRKVIELDILESQINSGWIYKENALVNPKDVFLSGQGRGLALKESAQMSDVMPIQSPQIPPSMIELSRILGEEIMQISGVNEELLGSAQDDKAGILSMLRQGAGLTTLQGLFDQLDQSQKILGQILIKLIQLNYAPGKIKRIIEEEPTPQFYNKNFGKYDAAVEEGFNTSTQRQMEFAQLLHLKEVGVPVPDDVLIEAATIQNKKKLIESIARTQQQQSEMQQAQAQAAMEEVQARTQLAQSTAQANMGLAVERASRVEENRALAVERLAEANKDDEMAMLNKIKAVKELEQLDLNTLNQLIGIINALKEQEVVVNRHHQAPSLSKDVGS